jgi:glutamyl-Q tRNA(Asp) synthetase
VNGLYRGPAPGRYRGRFAPSPTGPLHAGSLVAALASWLDARAQQGQWLVRLEDTDRARCVAGVDRLILQQLADCGLLPDEAPVWQSERTVLYQLPLDALVQRGLAYPCGCSRKDIEDELKRQGQARPRHGELRYPGTCRHGLHGKPARAWRLRTDLYVANQPLAPVVIGVLAIDSGADAITHWHDRRLGTQQQIVATEVGDFVLKRADGGFAYQLAVVVDDAAQGITDVVRGEDLADNTARQILLQHQLGLATPRYLHTPLVRDAQGEKLSKHTGAPALDTRAPLTALNAAAAVLGLLPVADNLGDALASWVAQWLARWPLPADLPAGPRLYNPAL